MNDRHAFCLAVFFFNFFLPKKGLWNPIFFLFIPISLKNTKNQREILKYPPFFIDLNSHGAFTKIELKMHEGMKCIDPRQATIFFDDVSICRGRSLFFLSPSIFHLILFQTIGPLLWICDNWTSTLLYSIFSP